MTAIYGKHQVHVMYLQLLLLCLHLHFCISSYFLEAHPHAIKESQVNFPLQLTALGESRKQQKSADHWNQENCPSKDITTENQSHILEARAGGGTGASGLLDKQWAKKIRQAASRWESSVNGKILKALLLREILPDPYVSVTQALAMLHGSPTAQIWEQLAALESLLEILSTLSF
jgi:hypothetical protein